MITVFGSINLDVTISVAQFPKAGETIHGSIPSYSPGGKGANQAFAAASQGVKTRLIGATGCDEAAILALGSLLKNKADLSAIQKIPKIPTSQAIVTVDAEGENCIIVTDGANSHLQAALVNKASLRNQKFLLLQLETPIEQSLSVAQKCRELGMKVILTPAPMAKSVLELLPFIDMLALNELELDELHKLLQRSQTEDLRGFLKFLNSEFGLDILLTRGKDGAEFHSNQPVFSIEAQQITPVDTTGAGDTFVGAFCAGLALDDTIEQALSRASKAASRTCLSQGAQVFS